MCTGIDVMYGGMFMERGTAEHIFKRPRNPYTLGLLESVPRLDYTRRVKLRPIKGAPRDMLSFPTACPFQPRCRFEVEQSRQEVPHLVEIEPGHYVACFNPVPVDEWQKSREEAAG
jgi:oligopeptide/dipeptide ABC transporter ATP-binding protein